MKSNFWKDGKYTTIIGGVLFAASTQLQQFPVLSIVLATAAGLLGASKDPKMFV